MPTDTLSTWHQIVKTTDEKALAALLDETAVFHSPVVHTPQVGKALTHKYLAAAFKVLFNDSFRYTREVTSGNDAVLEFELELDGIRINGVDLIHWNDAGLITDFKVMLRPLKAVNLIHQKMGAQLIAAQQAARQA